MKKTSTFFALTLLVFSLCNFSYSQTPSWWPEKSLTLSSLRNINFADNNTGWFFGDSVAGVTFKFGLIKKTTNQGLNWSLQSMGSNNIQIYSSYAFSPSSIIGVGRFLTTGNGAIIKTTDGGITWLKDTSTIAERLYDVDFASPNTGWVVGKNGYLAKSTNGGSTWSTQTTGTVQNLYSVDFVDANNGWAVGVGSTIIHTTNGGTSYSIEACPLNGDLLAVYAFNSTKAIVTGQGGNMAMTTNSGTTWSVVTTGIASDILDITFVDALNGWAVSTGGVIIISNDGGLTWTTQVTGTSNDITSICMKNTGLGWFCGKNGTVHYYGTSPVSVNELMSANNNITIYPNPMSDKTTINLNGSTYENWNLNLSDVAGKCIMQVNNIKANYYEINSSNLLPGIYFYTLSSSSGMIAKGKLIISK